GCDVAHLAGEVGGHRVHGVGEVLPGAGDAGDVGLATQPALGADLAGDAGDLRGERVELDRQGVEDVRQLQDLAAHVHRELLRQVAVRHGGGHVGDVTDLAGEVAGHEVDGVGEVFPGAGDAGDVGLAAQPAFRADLAGDAGDLRGEGVE